MAAAEDTASRVAGIEGLGAWGDSAAYEPAVAALKDSRPAVRRAAARALAQIDDTRCPEPLVRALGDEDASVREALATAIGAIGPPALASVASALSEPALEDGALEALGRLPVDARSSSMRAYISERTASALHYDRLGRAAFSTGQANDGRQLLADSLRHATVRDATNALRAVGLLGDGDAVAAAIEGLNGPDPAQRANAVEILDSIAEREAVQPVLRLWEPDRDTAPADGSSTEWLLDVLRDQDPWLRAGAALAAGSCEFTEVHPELRKLAQSDPDPTVREAAAAALNGGDQMETLSTLPLMERVLFLRRVPLFADLTPGELKQVAAIAREYVFVDGETISRQNDPGDELYIIVSGEVLVRVSADGKAEEQLARRRAGDYVGEMSIISREPRMASLVAAGNVRTLNIDQTQFEGILRERPETSLAVMRVLCERLREKGSNGLEAYTH
jgi:HEAT repeat protein